MMGSPHAPLLLAAPVALGRRRGRLRLVLVPGHLLPTLSSSGDVLCGRWRRALGRVLGEASRNCPVSLKVLSWGQRRGHVQGTARVTTVNTPRLVTPATVTMTITILTTVGNRRSARVSERVKESPAGHLTVSVITSHTLRVRPSFPSGTHILILSCVSPSRRRGATLRHRSGKATGVTVRLVLLLQMVLQNLGVDAGGVVERPAFGVSGGSWGGRGVVRLMLVLLVVIGLEDVVQLTVEIR